MNLKENTNSEGVNYTKSIGIFEAEVVAVNPDREKYLEIYNISEENGENIKEFEYIKDKDGDTMLLVSFILKDVKTEKLFNLRFNIIDKLRVSQSGKSQWINQLGDSSWADDKANLPQWFTNFTDRDKNVIADKKIIEAHVGEAELYEFIKCWLNKGINIFDPECDILLDWKKLMRGNTKELESLVGSEFAGTVVCVATVRTVEDEEKGTKEYQGVYNRAFLPGSMMKLIRTGDKKNKTIKKFLDGITDGEYGIKDAHTVEELQDYDAGTYVAGEGKAVSDTGSDY